MYISGYIVLIFSSGSNPPLGARICARSTWMDTNADFRLSPLLRVSVPHKKTYYNTQYTRFRVFLTLHVSVPSPHVSVLCPIHARLRAPIHVTTHVSSLRNKNKQDLSLESKAFITL